MPITSEGSWRKFFAEHPEAFEMPLFIVLEALQHLHLVDTVLDLGAGPGRHGKLLAVQGMQVHAIEQVAELVSSLNQFGRDHDVALTAWQGDITEEINIGRYHLIVCTFVAHELSHEDGLRLVAKCKDHTMPGGLNVFVSWINEGALWDSVSDERRFFLRQGELINIYADWERIHYEECIRPTVRTGDDGLPLSNMAAFLLARKPLNHQ